MRVTQAAASSIVLRCLLLAVVVPAVPALCGEYIAITEILKNPLGGESAMPGGASHEYVEIANLGSDTLRIDSLFLSDGVDADSIVPWVDRYGILPACVSSARFLPPGRIGLVIDRQYDSVVVQNPTSRQTIRDGTFVFTVGDNDLGDGLAEDDGILLYKGTATTVARVLALAGDTGQNAQPQAGKIRQTSPGPMADGVSVALTSTLFGWPVYGACPSGTSPGAWEMLDSGWVLEYRLGRISGDTVVQCSLAVLRAGAGAGPATVRLGRSDGRGQPRALSLLSIDNRGIAFYGATIPLDSASYTFAVTDGAASASRRVDLSTIWVPGGAIRVSEIFPRAAPGTPEWLELANTAALPVNLVGWRFGNSEDSGVVSSGDFVVEPGAYCVVTSDYAAFHEKYRTVRAVVQASHWRTLDNYHDTLCLWDNRGGCQECIYYDSRWFSAWTAGSLARVSLGRAASRADNWAIADPPSPGLPNTAASWRAVSAASVDIGPTPFTPNGDGNSDYLSIRVALPAGSSLTLSVYGMDGRKLKTFASPELRQYLWDGRGDDGSPAPVGPIFVVAETTDPSGVKRTIRKKGILWR
jgi:hypothetical protein